MVAPPLEFDQLAVSCRGIVKEFTTRQGTTPVLRGLDLDIHLGELTYLIGPSGSGKSTLISIVAGILTPNRGTIFVLGTKLSGLRCASLARFRGANIGLVFQQFNLLPGLNALDNVMAAVHAQGCATGGSAARARDILDRLGLSKHSGRYPGQLSVGEQQRVAIARALVHEPSLLICDEPTASLDAASGQRVMELLRQVAVAPQRAVLVVTHDDRVLPFADRIAHMSDGMITRVIASNPRCATC